MSTCPSCGKPTAETWRFCAQCGHPTRALTAVCGICGELIVMNATIASVQLFFHDHLHRERRVCFLVHDACVDKLNLIPEHGNDIIKLGSGALSVGSALS